MSSNNINDNNVCNNSNTFSDACGQFGDTTLTKVFVGGLAWDMPEEALRQHFDKYGDILEAVIIYHKLTGRSKGYGFVTFKEAEAAKKACEDANPIINCRRANCNLASLGARRPRSTSTTMTSSTTPPQPQQVIQARPRSTRSPPAENHVQWYYPEGSLGSSPFYHQNQQPTAYYGSTFFRYSSTYIATDINYNQKLNYNNGGSRTYMNGVYTGQPITGGNTLMPIMYPLLLPPITSYGATCHLILPSTNISTSGSGSGSGSTTIISKPPPIPPTNSKACLTVD